jgi:FMN phosphatase YigB (HAD superfamily)
MIKVYSFDVFDTSLVRRIAVPSDAFALVANRVARRNGESAGEEWVRDFTAARLEAQRRAVAAVAGRECTLEQIWARLHELLEYLPQTCGPECELAVERDLLAPNHWVACKIAGLRARGARIVFTSDTYLPEGFIRSELIRHNLANGRDGFYVSSAAGFTKRTDGGLFDVLLREESVAAWEVHHLGDHLISDVRIPKERGIKATRFTGSQLNAWERAILDQHTTARRAATGLAGAMRTARLAAPYSPEIDVHELVSTFLGPAVTVWAAWVLGAAQRDKLSRLYFCSRDCYLLWRGTRVLARHFNDIDCRYLKISRRAVFLPSVLEISPAGMPWMEPDEPIHRLVQRAGLDWKEVADAFSAIADREGDKVLTTKGEWDAFWSVLQSPPIRALVEQRVQVRRASAISYLTSQGLMDPVAAAVVDIGWTSRVLSAIYRVFPQKELRHHLLGYYLGLFLDRTLFGKTKALFYEEAPDFQTTSARSSVIQRRHYFLSQVLGLAPHGTVVEYHMSGTQPEARCADVPAPHAVLVEQIADAVEAFCVEQAPNVIDYADEGAARALLEALIETWCTAPHEGALRVLEQGCRYARDHSNPLNEHPAALIEPWRLAASIKNLVPGRWRPRLGITVRNGLWPEASLLCSGRVPASLVRLREAAAAALRQQ